MKICLLMLLLTQYKNTDISTQAIHLGFDYQQEEFVFGEASPIQHKKELRQFDQMGVSDWRKRDKASKQCLQRCKNNPGETRWLFWGRHSGDPEIAYRCNNILKVLNKCETCNGLGTSNAWIQLECLHCLGYKTIWYLTPWE